MSWDCSECGRSVSDRTRDCVECGAPRKRDARPRPELQEPASAYRELKPRPDPVDRCDVPGCTLSPEEHRRQAIAAVRELTAKMAVREILQAK